MTINRYEYTSAILAALPTLCEGQAEDLKVEVELYDGSLGRVWLSRCGVEDGEPWENTVSLEVRGEDGMWRTALRWNGDNPAEYIAE